MRTAFTMLYAAAALLAPLCQAAAAPDHSRFMKVKQWNLHWTVVWIGNGSRTSSDGNETYSYSAGSGGYADMSSDEDPDPYFRTWRAPAGSLADGGAVYNITTDKPNGKQRTYDIKSFGAGVYESFPMSIDADKGTYSISIPCPSYDSKYTTVDEGYSNFFNGPYIVNSYPSEDAFFIQNKWSSIPLPEAGLEISGKYGFTSALPSGSVYIPEGAACTVSYTFKPVGEEEGSLKIEKISQKPKALAAAETDLVFKNKKLVFEAEASVLPKEYADKVTWETPDIGASKKTEKLSSDIKKGTAKIKVTYQNLPEKNSDFGSKTITAKCAALDKEAKKDIRVFFSRDDKDHPGEGSGDTRNWFFYWRQDGAAAAVPKLDQFEFVPGTIGGGYNPASKKLLVDATAVDLIPARNETITGCKHIPEKYSYTFNRKSVEGIEAAAAIVAHELTHKKLYESSNTWNDGDNDGVSMEMESSVPPETCWRDTDAFPDKPSCSNTFGLSASLFYGPRDKTTGKKRKEWNNAELQLQKDGDNEVKAIHSEQNPELDKSKDWAFPGIQAGK